jgi:diguanylate cyclase (GGDEF)-like protein/PAS domain S-box-containing protein
MAEQDTIRILLVEDNPDEAELFAAILDTIRGLSFSLTHATCLSQALEYLKKDVPKGRAVDVVLLDLNLPDSRGFGTYDRLYQQEPWVPVILLTGVDNEELALLAVRRGAQDYIVKSELDSGLLARALRYAIERKGVEEALRESEERYSLAIQGANDGLWDWQLKTNQIYFSPRWKTMLGYEVDEIGDHPNEWLSRIHPEDIDRVRLDLTAHLKGARIQFESEHRMQQKDGTYIWVLTRGLAVRDEHGKAYRMAGSQTDITLRKSTEELLLHNAFHDSLTGLPNRVLFMDRLGRAVERAKRHPDHSFAVLFLDLDRFKVINDSLGHTFGDQVLTAVGTILNSCLRTSDSIARLGGDEFVILLEDFSQKSEVELIAERIQQALQYPLEVEGQKVASSASIGIVLSDLKYENPEDILRDADIAMYHAKMLGKACHVMFNPSMRKLAIERMELENDLRWTLASEERLQQELAVVFQPIVSIEDGRIVGFEALLRWLHPERGPIMPNEFIPIAEETGLIHPLGLWVLREACKQVRVWQSLVANSADVPQISVSVNISGKQFSRPDLVDQIYQIVQENGITPTSLSLEITESLLLDSEGPFLETLDKLRGLGIKLQVDDFGRGYSSFGYLQRLPVSLLKIDSLFIRRLGANGENCEIVRSIIGLARSLGMSVIAEGVETDIQFQKLRNLDCPCVQGFYISKPVSGEKARELLLWNQSHIQNSFYEN